MFLTTVVQTTLSLKVRVNMSTQCSVSTIAAHPSCDIATPPAGGYRICIKRGILVWEQNFLKLHPPFMFGHTYFCMDKWHPLRLPSLPEGHLVLQQDRRTGSVLWGPYLAYQVHVHKQTSWVSKFRGEPGDKHVNYRSIYIVQ